MAGSEYTVHHSNIENWSSTYLTNHVEGLETKFVGLKNCGIPARHFRARLVLRPFLARSEGVWDPDIPFSSLKLQTPLSLIKI